MDTETTGERDAYRHFAKQLEAKLVIKVTCLYENRAKYRSHLTEWLQKTPRVGTWRSRRLSPEEVDGSRTVKFYGTGIPLDRVARVLSKFTRGNIRRVEVNLPEFASYHRSHADALLLTLSAVPKINSVNIGWALGYPVKGIVAFLEDSNVTRFEFGSNMNTNQGKSIVKAIEKYNYSLEELQINLSHKVEYPKYGTKRWDMVTRRRLAWERLDRRIYHVMMRNIGINNQKRRVIVLDGQCAVPAKPAPLVKLPAELRLMVASYLP